MKVEGLVVINNMSFYDYKAYSRFKLQVEKFKGGRHRKKL